MKNEFVPYDIALAMKELGFDERCYAYHSTHHGVPTFHTYYPSGIDNESKWNDDVIITPLYQQAFRWFREEHGLESYLSSFDIRWRHSLDYKAFFSTYEEAQDACLRKLIEICSK